jgi:hypothetical protein
MNTAFDVLTVTAFFGIALAYFKWGQQDLGLLMKLLLSGIALAVANQLGNSGAFFFGALLLLAATGYAVLLFHRHQNT